MNPIALVETIGVTRFAVLGALATDAVVPSRTTPASRRTRRSASSVLAAVRRSSRRSPTKNSVRPA